jgi:hypothetical protein
MFRKFTHIDCSTLVAACGELLAVAHERLKRGSGPTGAQPAQPATPAARFTEMD